MKGFNKVVVRNVTQQKNNVHLAVHPFFFNRILMMMNKGDYSNHDGSELTDWQKHLADELWNNIPGLSDLFFCNGEITIQHTGIFNDSEIFDAASEIIRPYLEENLTLINMEI